jgi:hypothetical protein
VDPALAAMETLRLRSLLAAARMGGGSLWKKARRHFKHL